MDQMFDLADLLLNKKVGLMNTAKLFIYVMPSLFIFTVPIAILSAITLLFARLGEDNEITAMRTAGISPLILIKPITVVAAVLSAVMIYFNATVAPAANSKFKTLYYQILYKNPIMQFSEKSFIQIQNYSIYVKNITKNGLLKNLLIYQWSDNGPIITTAKSAELLIVEEKGLLFRMRDGNVLQESAKKNAEINLMKFEDNEMILALNTNTDFLLNRESSFRELKSSALRKKARISAPDKKHLYEKEFHMRIAIGCASLFFVFIAAPLSISIKKRAKGYGITATIIIIFVYYILLIFASTISEKNIIPPHIAVWIPNLMIGITGLAMTLKLGKS